MKKHYLIANRISGKIIFCGVDAYAAHKIWGRVKEDHDLSFYEYQDTK
jgi:hypothetical protein